MGYNINAGIVPYVNIEQKQKIIYILNGTAKDKNNQKMSARLIKSTTIFEFMFSLHLLIVLYKSDILSTKDMLFKELTQITGLLRPIRSV